MSQNIDKIRLIYVNLTKHLNLYTDETKFEATIDTGEAFNIPNNMTLDELCELVSVTMLKVEKEKNLEECSRESFIETNKLLKKHVLKPDLNYKSGYSHVTFRYVPFKKYDLNNCCPEIESCLDLFVVDCDEKLFNKTSLKDRYVEWFVPQKEETNLKNNNKR